MKYLVILLLLCGCTSVADFSNPNIVKVKKSWIDGKISATQKTNKEKSERTVKVEARRLFPEINILKLPGGE